MFENKFLFLKLIAFEDWVFKGDWLKLRSIELTSGLEFSLLKGNWKPLVDYPGLDC